MSKPSPYFDQGKQNCTEYYNSHGFSSLTRNIRAEDAMRLFWPPVEEAMIMIERPLDKNRSEWLKGWKTQFKEILINLTTQTGI
jgi:hypothetical protein